MLHRLRFAAVLVLFLPYVIAGAQGISGLIKTPPAPEGIAVKDLPPDFRAVDIRTSASDFAQAMQMSMVSFGGNGQRSAYDLFQFSQTSWTDGKMIATDAGDFLITYRLVLVAPIEGTDRKSTRLTSSH